MFYVLTNVKSSSMFKPVQRKHTNGHQGTEGNRNGNVAQWVETSSAVRQSSKLERGETVQHSRSRGQLTVHFKSVDFFGGVC